MICARWALIPAVRSILSDQRGAQLLARLLWGLSYQRRPGTLILVHGKHLLPTPFEADRAVTLTRGVFRTVARTEHPQGVVAIGRRSEASFAEALAAARAARWPLVVLDRVQDPGNVGAIARSAAAAGAPALALLEGTADPFGPKAVRASAGHVFNLAVARAGGADLAGLRCLGAGVDGQPLDEVDLAGAEALVLGSEAHGLSRELPKVALPMAPGVESLNVAAAAAILLYEIRRRRDW